MPGESDDLEKLVESVADGESIDWDELERAAPNEESRQIVRHLRLVAEVADVHRSQVDNGALAEDAAVTAAAESIDSGLPAIPGAQGQRRVWPRIGSDPLPGNEGVWGHLLLVRKIGEGSFGEVYQAHDTWLDHPVALKLLKREAEARVQPSQLLHEARKLARVRHVNVVTVHGADRHNGRVGFWMDYIDGETLASMVSKGRLSAGEAVSVGQEVCRALAAVHQAKLIHRDVKAQNVMRAFDGGRIILMDFGAGEFVGDRSLGGRAQGTPLYLAPELLRGADATVRSDIYAVGVLMYHLVTGRFPVEAPSQAALVEAHARGERRRLRDERADLPDSFIAIVERAIDPNPERRYGSAGEMEAKLSGEPATRPVPVPLSSRSPGPTIGDYAKRATAVAAVVVALTGVLGFIAARAFEVVLRIDSEFALGLTGILVLGAQALLPFAMYWVLAAAFVGVLSGLRLLLPRRLMATPRRALASLASVNAPGMATIIFLSGATLALTLTWRYWEVFSVLWALRQDPLLPSAALSILNPASRPVHADYGMYSALLSFFLGLAVWRWFPSLEKRAEDGSALRPMKWGTIAIAFLVVAMAVAPRRAVWESFTIASFEKRPALVIGTAGEYYLLYAPDESNRPRFRVSKKDADAMNLQLTAETRALFEREP